MDSSLGDDELYLWTISASSTDPYVHTATPEVGLFSLYVWFACSTQGGEDAVFRLSGSLNDHVVGVTAIDPFVLTTFWNGDLVLHFLGCRNPPLPALNVLVLDDFGTGGSLCLEAILQAPFENSTLECNGSESFPNAVIGFTSNGTAPCEIGSCRGPISVESGNWGSIKSLYR